MATGRRLRFAVVGCGGRGMGYVKLLGSTGAAFPDVELLALCDPHAPTREAAASEHGVGVAHLHASVEGLLDSEDGELLDAVLLATPAHLNAICALPCIRAGRKHKRCRVMGSKYRVLSPGSLAVGPALWQSKLSSLYS
eukprot:SAG11_NODE_8058_length_1064_cov_1.176166_2_plen_139_part_00